MRQSLNNKNTVKINKMVSVNIKLVIVFKINIFTGQFMKNT